MNDLKPCPSCGSTHVGLERMNLAMYDRWEIRCKVCPIMNTISFPTKDEAVSKWNGMWCWKEIGKLLAELASLKESGDSFHAMAAGMKQLEANIQTLKTNHEKEIEDYKARIKKLSEVQAVIAAPLQLTPDGVDWKARYDKIKDSYIRTRLEVSGSFGNWDYNTKKRVLEHEISNEVGFII